MREQLEQRLRDLRSEFESGQKLLAELNTRRQNVEETLLRISGAIQVIEEMLTGQTQAATDGVAQSDTAVRSAD
jgi:ABC-type transporter Mla subunit MlaD